VPFEAQRLMRWLQRQDPDAAAHSRRVAVLAVALARELGLESCELAEVDLGARLHDVGKGLLPRSLVGKTGPPTPTERFQLRTHTLLGARLLRDARLPEPLATVAATHHEWWDGGGYPLGLRGEDIPLSARITAVADAFDAMTVRRCYREARTPEVALEELRRGTGSQFCPEVIAAFDPGLAAPERLA